MCVEPLDFEQILAVLEGDFERIRQPLFDPAADREPIDDHIDRVALILVELDLVAQFDQLAVNLDAHETGAPQVRSVLFYTRPCDRARSARAHEAAYLRARP